MFRPFEWLSYSAPGICDFLRRRPGGWDRSRFEHLWVWSSGSRPYSGEETVRGYYAMPMLWATTS